jgi:hypothetical protein
MICRPQVKENARSLTGTFGDPSLDDRGEVEMQEGRVSRPTQLIPFLLGLSSKGI